LAIGFIEDSDMSTVVIELPPEHLKKGIYVCGLDRPWEGTPFLFQGFVIETDTELQILRRLCKVVYVEVTVEDAEELRSAASRTAYVAPSSAGAPDQIALLTENLTASMGRVPARDPKSLDAELAAAKVIYSEAKRAIGSVFDHLRRGGALDVPHLQSVVGSMVNSVFRNRDALSWLASMKSKDDYLYSHSLSSSVWALAFGRHLGLDKETLTLVGTGAMLLDIGKTQLPTELLKKPGEPSDSEWQLIRAHVDHGVRLIESTLNVDKRIVAMMATHHERLDGKGYPNNLKGDEIPLLGRVAAIVDCYDAMISQRNYATAKSSYDAVRELKQLGGTAFPSEMVELFIQAVGVFPTGTLVELNTGEVGVVTGQNRYRRLRPEVMLILDANKTVREEFSKVDLLTCEENIGKAEPTLWIARGLEHGAYGIDPSEYFL
jgi:HD-GYP domain-containing protein (c-di-GMP phosphodiesterase class II)